MQLIAFLVDKPLKKGHFTAPQGLLEFIMRQAVTLDHHQTGICSSVL
jgi:hypothetical protein